MSALYGHRRDVVGYAHAIEDFDLRIPRTFKQWDSLLWSQLTTAMTQPLRNGSHGEYVPLLAYSKKFQGQGKNYKATMRIFPQRSLKTLVFQLQKTEQAFYNI